MQPPTRVIRNQRGAALILTLMITIAIAAMAMGAIILSSGAQLTTKFTARESAYQAVADGGLQIIRDSINRGSFDALLPLNGFTTIATDQPITDASNNTLAGGVTRSLYVGRTGGRTGGAATAGQYGSNFASAISVISDKYGAVAARRLLLTQESWAKFAVAINNWSGGAMYGCSEEVHGPFHSNTGLNLQGGCSSGLGTLFTGPATVVGSISNQASGRFQRGVKTGASAITWPTPARINLMQQYAQDADAAGGDYDLTSITNGLASPGLRIEFVTVDVNRDGAIQWNEGYMRVFVSSNTSDSALAFNTGRRWPTQYGFPYVAAPVADPNTISRNCGGVMKVRSILDPSDSNIFHTARDIYVRSLALGLPSPIDSARKALSLGSRRCFLGGDPRLYKPETGDTLTPIPSTTAPFGFWKTRRLGAYGPMAAVRPTDAVYLIPLGANANFKGVIFVQGDVALSGKLAGRVSVFATGNIVMADDLTYTNAPGSKCDAEGDIFGAIATSDVIIENNNLQTPFAVNNKVFGGYDDTNDANYNMFFLAAGNGTSTGNWYGEGVTSPWNYYAVPFPVANESGANANWDASAVSQMCGTAINGCVRVTGGLGQGRVDGATYYGAGYYGWAEAHTYDPCGAVNPPPYFPTTGRFIESRYYELDPVWLKSIGIATFFAKLRAQ